MEAELAGRSREHQEVEEPAVALEGVVVEEEGGPGLVDDAFGRDAADLVVAKIHGDVGRYKSKVLYLQIQ